MIEPTFSHIPDAITREAGQEAIELAELAGLYLDPWQQWAMRQALGERENGLWSSFEVAVILPRQNGKGSLLEARELAGLFLHEDERLILHSAHEFKTAAEAFRRIRGLIRSSPLLMNQVKHIYTASGQEAIELKNGKRLMFVARSTGSGRGFSGDLVILDEAYALTATEMAALLPTMSARPNPQLWYTSSAGMANSEHLRLVRERGRNRGSHRMTYLEWCAKSLAEEGEPLDLDNRQSWREANPGMGIRIREEFIESEREALPDDEFARERLGRWDDPAEGIPAFDFRDWTGCLAPEDWIPNHQGQLVLAVDIAWNRMSAGIVAAQETDQGFITLDSVEYRLGSPQWLIPMIDRLVKSHKPAWIVYDPTGPVGSIEAQLEAKHKKRLRPIGPRDMAQGCGDLYDLIFTRAVRHTGQAELNAAILGAVRVDSGDTWRLGRTKSSADIAPAVAAVGAVWGVRNRKVNYGQNVW